MLKAMVLRNFVQFQGKHVLNFGEGNGATYFIGASSSGKTAVLELLRRCMSSRLNSSVTNRFNEKEHGFVFCQFETDKKRNGADRKRENVIAGFIVEGTEDRQSKGEVEVEDNGKKDGILAAEQRDDVDESKRYEKEEMWKEDVKFHKIMIYHANDDKLPRIRSKSFFERGGKIIDLRKNVKLEKSIGSDFKEVEAKLFKDSTDGAASFVEDLLNAIKERQEENDTYDCYPALWNEISDQFVGILPLRGPGTFQWTRSKYISGEFREKNYNDVCEQAEIINELLKSEDVDHKKEREIFSFLTRPDVFEFERKGSNEIIVMKEGKSFPLLKVSVGIMEAKQFALLMAHKEFRTICLEEPERGLHPQMIERMKEILHRHCEGKTVIAVTHSPAFIDSVSIKRAYIFFRKRNDPSVRSLTKISMDLLRKELNISEIEELKRIFFATRVLFVEGKSDRIVMQAIFRRILQIQDSKENENIVDHQIVELSGKGSFESLQAFCETINLPYCAVLDRDKYIKVKDGKVCNKKGALKVDNVPIPDNLPIEAFLTKYFEKFAEELMNGNIFIWKDGDLEDFVLSETNRFENIFDILEEEEEGDILHQNLSKKLKRDAIEEIKKENLEELTKEKIEELEEKRFEELKKKKAEELKKQKLDEMKDLEKRKNYVKDCLKKGLSFDGSEKLGQLLLDPEYQEVRRLRTFLKEISLT